MSSEWTALGSLMLIIGALSNGPRSTPHALRIAAVTCTPELAVTKYGPRSSVSRANNSIRGATFRIGVINDARSSSISLKLWSVRFVEACLAIAEPAYSPWRTIARGKSKKSARERVPCHDSVIASRATSAAQSISDPSQRGHLSRSSRNASRSASDTESKDSASRASTTIASMQVLHCIPSRTSG